MSAVTTPRTRVDETSISMPETLDQGERFAWDGNLVLTPTQKKFIRNMFVASIAGLGVSGLCATTALIHAESRPLNTNNQLPVVAYIGFSVAFSFGIMMFFVQLLRNLLCDLNQANRPLSSIRP